MGYEESTSNMSAPEPTPTPNNHPDMWDLVQADMRDRQAFGLAKYGTGLQPFNGRKPLVDAYQEELDKLVYLRQEIYEREHDPLLPTSPPNNFDLAWIQMLIVLSNTPKLRKALKDEQYIHDLHGRFLHILLNGSELLMI